MSLSFTVFVKRKNKDHLAHLRVFPLHIQNLFDEAWLIKCEDVPSCAVVQAYLIDFALRQPV